MGFGSSGRNRNLYPSDADKLRLATDTEAEAPALTGKALGEYAAENTEKLFGERATGVATVEDVADHILLAGGTVDELIYNEIGNEVLLVKYMDSTAPVDRQ
jgi:hypothetical protein